jgi:hypothetical protein
LTARNAAHRMRKFARRINPMYEAGSLVNQKS